ncbi:MAG: hypothetical protein AB9856_08695 [Cellulosilyticaceae bacterium]
MRKNLFFGMICSMLLVYFIFGILVKQNAFYLANTNYYDLSGILDKPQFSQEDYILLQEQTGLYPPVIDVLKKEENFIDKIKDFQSNYLADINVTCEKMNFVTSRDIAFSQAGNNIKLFDLAPYKNGYIFLTKSTHTFNFRHGHAAIVIDEKRGKTLEALEPGTVTMEQNVSKWEFYPTFKMMRLKDTPQATLDSIATYATYSLRNIPYNIFAMKNQGSEIKSTECSLLVWQAFNHFGYNLDYNGRLFVLPQDIAKSPLLEVLQIYGFNPEKDW